MSDGTRAVGDAIHLTDLGNSRLLVEAHGENIRWCNEMRGLGWVCWDGDRWKPDNTKQVVRYASTIGDIWRRKAPPEEEDNIGLDEAAAKRQQMRKAILKHATKCESNGSINAALELAASHPMIAIQKSEFDSRDYLFNTPGMTFDLKRFKRNKPDRLQYITKVARVTADQTPCPLWEAFLLRVMNGNAEMVSFLQRMAGYCLTGSTIEQKMFTLWGSGKNGKSTFANILSWIMGDYATTTSVNTFTDRRQGAIPNDLAALDGARLVTCSEGSEGSVLEDSLIKLVTGGDPIVARFLNREFFEYNAKFKLVFLTNHKPIIKGTDKGIWRRQMLIPFTVTIPEEECDPDLVEKLRKEASGILRWCIQGAREWHERGLAPPDLVVDATEEYRQEMDTLGGFLEDCCDISPGDKVTNTALYNRYKTWAEDQGMKCPMSQKKLSMSLKERGFTQDPGRANGRTWSGLSLKNV
jgi:putative DNA primase/helicase